MIRRPIRNINNPMLQNALFLNEQRNPNAAIKGNLGRNIFGAFAAREGANEIAAQNFGRRHALAKRSLADRVQQHGAVYGMRSRALRDAKKGTKFATLLGLGQMGLGYMDNRAAKKTRASDKIFRQQMQQYLLNSRNRRNRYSGGIVDQNIYGGGNPNLT